MGKEEVSIRREKSFTVENNGESLSKRNEEVN